MHHTLGTKQHRQIPKSNGNTVQNISLLEDANVLDDVVVTGVVNPKSRLESSVSVSSIGIKQIEQSAPRSTGEVFRNIPGIKSRIFWR
jgi:outer membrane cobalamin receptor